VEAIKVLLVDDHAVVREGYRRLLENDAQIRVIGEAADAADAYRCFRELTPDVVVMDIALPGASGLEAMRRMLANRPKARVLVFSMYEDAIYVKQALREGACGYLTKASAPEALITAVHRVAGGDRYVSEDVARHASASGFPAIDAAQGVGALSAREFEVLQLLVRGLSVNEIAAHLCVNQKTVANQQSSIKQKLGVENSAQLVLAALKAGLLSLGPELGSRTPGREEG
jgi:two-component system invasion response regulator UvrY